MAGVLSPNRGCHGYRQYRTRGEGGSPWLSSGGRQRARAPGRTGRGGRQETMKSGLRTASDVLERQLKDPAFREQWERTALARAVALRLLTYRTEHGLSQTQLGKKLQMKQPAVARLESGEHTPSLGTLIH